MYAQKPIFVIYHSADYDGIFCREIARKFFGQNASYIGWDYGQPAPYIGPNAQLYILDLSIDELMSYPGLVWIDHHRSAIEKYSKDIAGYRIDGVAACRLVWQWFFSETGPGNPNLQEPDYRLPTDVEFKNRSVSEPMAVRLAGEYDVWDHRDDEADVAFQFGLDSRDTLSWILMLGDGVATDSELYVRKLVEEGRAAMRCYAKRDADVMRTRSFVEDFEGLKFLCLNTARCNSNTFKALDIPSTGHDALMVFYWTGWDFSVSLYHAAHRKDLDLSKIAVKFGGGGHPSACGFRAMKLPFLQ